ncbi:MAG: DLW-39 family protein [Antricoccus sp.]
MKKLFLLAAAIGGVVFVRKQQAAKAEADLWHEATTVKPAAN